LDYGAGVSPQRAKLDMILFLADMHVKENRKTLLCKRSGGAIIGNWVSMSG